MTYDITLSLTDPTLSVLIFSELTAAGYSVGTARGAECRLLITDQVNVPAAKDGMFTLCISREAREGFDACLLRPFSLSSLREAVAAFEPFFKEGVKEKAPMGLSLLPDGLLCGGEKVKLSRAERRVISMLYEAGGEPVSRERINSLLGMKGNAADVYVCNIRKKLAAAGAEKAITTHRSLGYALLRDS